MYGGYGVNNLAALFGALILLLLIAKKIMDENTLETFREKFLKFERKERERLLKKYIKSKNKKEQRIASDVFFEYFEDISKELREEIFEYLLKKETEIQYLLEILDKYFNDISHSVRNDALLKMILAKEFGIIKIIKNHLKEIPTEILNKAFIELYEDREMMEILNDYDKSTCMDEKIKEEALKKYVETKWINADVEILKKFLERGIQDKKLREDIMTIQSLEEKKKY